MGVCNDDGDGDGVDEDGGEDGEEAVTMQRTPSPPPVSHGSTAP